MSTICDSMEPNNTRSSGMNQYDWVFSLIKWYLKYFIVFLDMEFFYLACIDDRGGWLKQCQNRCCRQVNDLCLRCQNSVFHWYEYVIGWYIVFVDVTNIEQIILCVSSYDVFFFWKSWKKLQVLYLLYMCILFWTLLATLF